MYTHTRSRVVRPGPGSSSISRDHAGHERRKELDLKQSQRQSLEVPASKDAKMEGQGLAEQELADLERWKQQNRAKPVHLVPQRLGGSQSEFEVRQKQQLQQMRSKYQQKLKRDESIRIRKEAEEAKLQQMKAIQREKLLSRLDTDLRNRSACQIAPHAGQSSTW
ncbi:Epsti1 [Phodopus roborovskii]|uniref:Epsti1 protein n=1 Tax=Phodopus roborovskii TaxID=109678 RepID=A0AAU9ZTA7_PHORO|nr:Epsti1 [Phodopus roborovskii]